MFRDGQNIEDNVVGGVVANLHHPKDWWLFEKYAKHDEKRVYYAIGCHPKQATLLSPARLRRMEERLCGGCRLRLFVGETMTDLPCSGTGSEGSRHVNPTKSYLLEQNCLSRQRHLGYSGNMVIPVTW